MQSIFLGSPRIHFNPNIENQSIQGILELFSLSPYNRMNWNLNRICIPFVSHTLISFLVSTLEISTILVITHKEESLDKRSWVYEKRIGITQIVHIRTAQDVHKPHARESYAMCIGHVHGNRMAHARGQLHEERFFSFSRHVLHYKQLIQEHPDPGMSIFFFRSLFHIGF